VPPGQLPPRTIAPRTTATLITITLTTAALEIANWDNCHLKQLLTTVKQSPLTTTLGILSSLSLLPFKATRTSQFSGILHKQSFSSSDHLDSLRTLTLTLKLLSREFRVDVVTSSKGYLSQWKINSFRIFSNFSQQTLLCTLSHRIHSTHS